MPGPSGWAHQFSSSMPEARCRTSVAFIKWPVTISFGPGKTNVYEDAEKVFQLGQKRIGIAIYGMAGIGDRSIGSYIREFEARESTNLMSRNCSLGEVAEGLRAFL